MKGASYVPPLRPANPPEGPHGASLTAALGLLSPDSRTGKPQIDIRRNIAFNPIALGLYEFAELTTQHRMTRKIFDEWLHRPGRTPVDVALKTRLRALLGISS